MAVPQTIGKGVVTASRIGFIGVAKFILKHLYIFSIILFILPTVITSVKTGIAENNPIYPFTELSITLTNADKPIDDTVNQLREDPKQLVGEKPDGLISKGKYYWRWGLVIWKLLGNIFLISIPFVLAYRYFKWKGKQGVESSPGQNIKNALIVGFGFIFLFNLILTIVGLIDGSLIMSFPEGIDIYKKVWLIFLNTIPFHGVINLILYLTGVSLVKV